MPRQRRTTQKVQDRVGRIFDGIQEGKALTQIAADEGITERAVRYNMGTPEFQLRMNTMLVELSRKVPGWVQELHDSDDPQDKRTAATLGMQMLKAKIPHQTESLNVNVNIDQETQIFGDIFDKLTPEEQAPIIEAYKNRRVPRMVNSESKIIDVIPEGENEVNG